MGYQQDLILSKTNRTGYKQIAVVVSDNNCVEQPASLTSSVQEVRAQPIILWTTGSTSGPVAQPAVSLSLCYYLAQAPPDMQLGSDTYT